jgi:hypothetical protein
MFRRKTNQFFLPNFNCDVLERTHIYPHLNTMKEGNELAGVGCDEHAPAHSQLHTLRSALHAPAHNHVQVSLLSILIHVLRGLEKV